MMGKVRCRLLGGLKGEEILTLPAMYCRDTLSLVNDAWIAQGQDGNVVVMKGSIPQRAPWISFTRDIYEKEKPIVSGCATYNFVRTVEVNRCEKVLDDKGRRCRNEAESGAKLCRVHQRSKLT